MKTFFKLLFLLLLAANMILIFGFDRLIPTDLHLPFGHGSQETALTEEKQAEVQNPGPVEEEEEETSPEIPAEKHASGPETEAALEEPGQEEGTGLGESEEAEVSVCRIISEEGSNIRSGPGMDYEIIASFPYDTILSLTGEAEGGWYPVLYEDGTEGYIFETQIEIPGEAEDGTSGQAADRMQ